ncbi:MAG: PEP-CTERM sorting domain-containing protein [Phycisphaeraceae bacterium]|nr:PEP-CTERM sorting domain-containing protein [Phycisphaeraceae bacterium]
MGSRMMNCIAVMGACWLCLLLPAASVSGQPLPDFGVIQNHDSDVLYGYADGATNTNYINNLLTYMNNGAIGTQMFSVGLGSDILHYPTQAGSNIGWRTTPLDNDPTWASRVTIGKSWVAQNYDPIRAAGNAVKAMGDYFIPSYRMNDDHFVTDPLNLPITGEFWINNQDKTIGTSPVAGYDYSNLLDFSFQQVRDYRMSIINESIDRFADIMDGYELDFNRVQIFFTNAAEAAANAHHITSMVQQVRQKLDQVQTQTGRPQYLFVRVPPAMENNTWSGLQVDQWIAQGIVDVVLPASLQTLTHDMPIDDFMAIAQTAGSHTKVVPSLYPRTQHNGWKFVARPTATIYQGEPQYQVADADLHRGALSNYRYMGADTFQMYNYGPPWIGTWYEVAQDMANPEPTLGKNRVFAITPGYFNDSEDTYEYAKQLPDTLTGLQTKDYTLLIGDDIQRMIRERPDDVMLRLGLNNASSTRLMTVWVNGHRFHTGNIAGGYYTTNATLRGNGPQAYLHITVGDLLALQQGENTIRVRYDNLSGSVQITDLQLGIFGADDPDAGLPKRTMRQPQINMLKQVYYDGNGPTMNYTINNRTNNGYDIGQGGVYITGQVSSYSQSYTHAAGFIFDQAAYYPTVEGELESIDYQFWMGKTSASRPTSFVSLLLVQNDKHYALSNPVSFENGDPLTFMTLTGSSLSALDFFEEKPNADGYVLDPYSHPDFSASGAPIYVGFMLSRSGNPNVAGNDQPYTDLDDFIVTFNSVVPPPPQPGDANGDGLVNLSDLQVLGDHWMSTTATWAQGDFTGEGAVTLADLQILADNWGFGVGSDVALAEALLRAGIDIPEPASMVMLGLGIFLTTRRLRH